MVKKPIKTESIHTALKKTKSQLLFGLKSIIFFSLLVFLFVNIIVSQLISPLYFQLVNDNRSATAQFLKDAQKLQEYNAILTQQENIYGNSIVKDINEQHLKRQQAIVALEEILKTNPKSRDVLYDLSLLYKNEGSDIKSQEYMDKAKAIDPGIERNL